MTIDNLCNSRNTGYSFQVGILQEEYKYSLILSYHLSLTSFHNLVNTNNQLVSSFPIMFYK